MKEGIRKAKSVECGNKSKATHATTKAVLTQPQPGPSTFPVSDSDASISDFKVEMLER